MAKIILFVFTFTLLAACMNNEPKSSHKLDAARSHGTSDMRGFLQLDRDALGNVIVPADCVSWFDGCNSCGRMVDGSAPICTEMACEGEPKRAYCKKHSE